MTMVSYSHMEPSRKKSPTPESPFERGLIIMLPGLAPFIAPHLGRQSCLFNLHLCYWRDLGEVMAGNSNRFWFPPH